MVARLALACREAKVASELGDVGDRAPERVAQPSSRGHCLVVARLALVCRESKVASELGDVGDGVAERVA